MKEITVSGRKGKVKFKTTFICLNAEIEAKKLDKHDQGWLHRKDHQEGDQLINDFDMQDLVQDTMWGRRGEQ